MLQQRNSGDLVNGALVELSGDYLDPGFNHIPYLAGLWWETFHFERRSSSTLVHISL